MTTWLFIFVDKFGFSTTFSRYDLVEDNLTFELPIRLSIMDRRNQVLARLEARHGKLVRPCHRDTPTIEAAGVAGDIVKFWDNFVVQAVMHSLLNSTVSFNRCVTNSTRSSQIVQRRLTLQRSNRDVSRT